MTVQELIQKLSQYPNDTPIFYEAEKGYMPSPVVEVDMQSVFLPQNISKSFNAVVISGEF